MVETYRAGKDAPTCSECGQVLLLSPIAMTMLRMQVFPGVMLGQALRDFHRLTGCKTGTLADAEERGINVVEHAPLERHDSTHHKGATDN